MIQKPSYIIKKANIAKAVILDSCGGTNGNHDVTCNVHDETGITHLTCTVADPAISGGVNVGNCITNNNKHLQCTIPPTPSVFGCNLQS